MICSVVPSACDGVSEGESDDCIMGSGACATADGRRGPVVIDAAIADVVCDVV